MRENYYFSETFLFFFFLKDDYSLLDTYLETEEKCSSISISLNQSLKKIQDFSFRSINTSILLFTKFCFLLELNTLFATPQSRRMEMINRNPTVGID